MYRSLIRRAIRALADEAGTAGVPSAAGQVLRTYSHNSVLFLPEDADPATDAQNRMAQARALTDRILRGEIRPYVERAGATK